MECSNWGRPGTSSQAALTPAALIPGAHSRRIHLVISSALVCVAPSAVYAQARCCQRDLSTASGGRMCSMYAKTDAWRQCRAAVFQLLEMLSVTAQTLDSSASRHALGGCAAVGSGLPLCLRRVPSVTCLGASCLTHDRFNQLESSTFRARSPPRTSGLCCHCLS